jgi:5,10-methenyltetrahydromethanopterin hydrogenase
MLPQVQPFASLVDRVNDDVPRSLWNREAAGVVNAQTRELFQKLLKQGLSMPGISPGFVFEGKGQYVPPPPTAICKQ